MLRTKWLSYVLCLAFLSLFLFESANAALKPYYLSTKDKISHFHWWSEKDVNQQFIRLKGLPKRLFLLKKYHKTGDNQKCVEIGRSLRSKALSISPWVIRLELECATRLLDIKKFKVDQVIPIQRALDKKPKWMMIGAYSTSLRQAWINSQFSVLNWYLTNYPARGFGVLDQLFSRLSWLNETQAAELFRKAGELAFIRQNLSAARSYYTRSLKIKDDPELRSKIKSIESRLLKFKKKKESDEKSVVVSNDDLEASEREIEITKRISEGLEKGDLVPAIEDCLVLIKDYPRGIRADWAADRVAEVYISLLDAQDEKFKVIEQRVTNLIVSSSDEMLFLWAYKVFRKGYFEEAYNLARGALKKSDGREPSTKELMVLARAAYANGDWGNAKKFYKRIFELHSGTEGSREALFRLGLLAMRKKSYSEAAGHLERLLVLPNLDKFELSARYWLYRALQKIDKERAKSQVDVILTRFPLSYWGLRVRADQNAGVIDRLGPESEIKEEVRVKIDLTEPESDAIVRIKTLINSGWHEEAQLELAAFPSFDTSESKALFARLWFAADDYLKSIQVMNEAWNEDLELIRSPFIGFAYPRDYEPLIKKFNTSLYPELILGLMRQESAFYTRAVSSSGALGLMQLIPPTAEEVASELGVKDLKLPESMFDPEMNVRFGTHYISKMVREFGGNIPFAVAAYNAGPHRVKSWIETRKLKLKESIEPQDELWIEELPWSETRFYVKAILRNILIYRYLDAGRVEVKGPFWKLIANGNKSD